MCYLLPQDGCTPLYHAAVGGNKDVVVALLVAKAQLDPLVDKPDTVVKLII